MHETFEGGIGFVHLNVAGGQLAVADVFRLNGTCVMEHWDVDQARPANATNPLALFWRGVVGSTGCRMRWFGDTRLGNFETHLSSEAAVGLRCVGAGGLTSAPLNVMPVSSYYRW